MWANGLIGLHVSVQWLLEPKVHDLHTCMVAMQDLSARYGHPVVVLNLVKSAEKRPRETILRKEFAISVAYINQQVLITFFPMCRQWPHHAGVLYGLISAACCTTAAILGKHAYLLLMCC